MNSSKVGHNEAWVKSVSYDEFHKHNAHLKHLTNLEADYKRITGKPVEVEHKEAEKLKATKKK